MQLEENHTWNSCKAKNYEEGYQWIWGNWMVLNSGDHHFAFALVMSTCPFQSYFLHSGLLQISTFRTLHIFASCSQQLFERCLGMERWTTAWGLARRAEKAGTRHVSWKGWNLWSKKTFKHQIWWWKKRDVKRMCTFFIVNLYSLNVYLLIDIFTTFERNSEHLRTSRNISEGLQTCRFLQTLVCSKSFKSFVDGCEVHMQKGRGSLGPWRSLMSDQPQNRHLMRDSRYEQILPSFYLCYVSFECKDMYRIVYQVWVLSGRSTYSMNWDSRLKVFFLWGGGLNS